MKLTSVQIQYFKSIKDSTEFTIEEKVTCLVGKNESGKTATLQAIAKANSADSQTAKFDELDFPRHELNEFQKTKASPPALITKWSLDPEDRTKLEPLIGEANANSIDSFIF